MARSILLLGLIYFLVGDRPRVTGLTDSNYNLLEQGLLADDLSRETHPELVWETNLQSDGHFSDLDYENNFKPEWAALTHLSRAYVWALQSKKSKSAEDAKKYLGLSKSAIHYYAIRFHSTKPLYHINWWHREIGLPKVVYPLALLIKSDLNEFDRTALFETVKMGHLTDHPSHWPAKGQNLIWYSEITTALGVLYQKPEWVRLAKNAIERELKPGKKEGIQIDQSFFQHQQVLYSGGYGLDFAINTAKLFKLFQGTEFQLSNPAYQDFSRYVLDGLMWSYAGDTVDFSSAGRYYARPHYGSPSVLMPACEIMSAIPGNRVLEYKECVRSIQAHEMPKPYGIKPFFIADYLVMKNARFMISVKMNSTRVYNSDWSPLGEGLKSEFLSDGVTYFYRNQKEYTDIFPIFDFKRVPGTTVPWTKRYPTVPLGDYRAHPGTDAFVGMVSHDNTALATQTIRRYDFSLKKSWFLTEEGIVVLVGDIENKTGLPLKTSLNQEWAKTEMLSGKSANSSWAWSNQMGYVVHSKSPLVSSISIQAGSRKSIASALSDKKMTGKVASVFLDQGIASHPDPFDYAVFPEVSKLEFQKKLKKLNYEVVSNTREIQALYFPEKKQLMATFFKPGTLRFNQGKNFFTVDHPVVIIFSESKNGPAEISVASPDHTVDRVQVDFKSGETALSQTLTLPSGSDAGKGVVVKLQTFQHGALSR